MVAEWNMVALTYFENEIPGSGIKCHYHLATAGKKKNESKISQESFAKLKYEKRHKTSPKTNLLFKSLHSIRGLEMLVFPKILRTYLMDDPCNSN